MHKMKGNIVEKAISHKTPSIVPYSDETQKIVNNTKERLKKTENLFLSFEETINLLDQLTQFELGRFLLHNRGLNGYWTSYIFQNAKGQTPKTPLEHWLLNKSLLVLARERLVSFQREIQKRIKPGIRFASIPCGLMDDLLYLNYNGINDFKLVGIDADPESLDFAEQNAKDHHLEDHTLFLQKDAWHLDIFDEFDLISSNGLNMYESDETRLIQLYQNFYQALAPEGTLIISFLPPPPENQDPKDGWKNFNVAPEDLLKEMAIFTDIVQIKYLNFCTEDKMIHQLKSANFKIDRVIYNEQGSLPIAIAHK